MVSIGAMTPASPTVTAAPDRPWLRLLNRAKRFETTFTVAVAVLIGAASGLGAVFFIGLIKLFQRICWGTWAFSMEAIAPVAWHWYLIIPGLGGAIVAATVHALAREAKGHGVPEVMAAVAIRGGVIRPRVVILKILASAMTIGTGGSVGREGPIVQIGSAIGSVLGQLVHASRRRLRTFVGCGAAAGIAATFNAPVAGVVFALEVILADFGVVQFSPIVVASVTATVISRACLGNAPSYDVPAYHLVSAVEFLPYAVLGVLAGAVAVAFIKILYGLEDAFDAAPMPEWLKGLVGGVAVGAIGLAYPQILGTGHQAVHQALVGDVAAGTLLALVVVKLLASSLTLSSGGSGGIFAPSLFLGAMLGGAVGTGANALLPGYTAEPGAYALVAMGAVVAGTTRAPMAAILILFEMTNDYHIILPLMVTCITATLVASWLERESIYTMKLRRRGIDLRGGQDVNLLRAVPVREVMRRDVATVTASTPLTEILTRAARTTGSAFFVVDDGGRPVGVVPRHDLWRWLDPSEHAPSDLVVAQDLADPTVLSVTLDDTLDAAARLFAVRSDDEVAVVDPSDGGRLVGSLWQADLMAAYNRRMFHDDAAGELAGRIGVVHDVDLVPLADGFILGRVPVPAAWAGQRVADLDIPARHGSHVLFVLRGPERRHELVTADTVLEADDVMLLVGPAPEVSRAASW